ncbi:hypothetical protein T06_2052 [Trichinella sp. T6]|nr:hypothetical protein T06_2052 [Trichinella sp. T6]
MYVLQYSDWVGLRLAVLDQVITVRVDLTAPTLLEQDMWGPNVPAGVAECNGLVLTRSAQFFSSSSVNSGIQQASWDSRYCRITI